MSNRKKLRDIEEQKRLLVAKADLQRSTFLMVADPVLRIVHAAEIGMIAARTGTAIARRTKK